LSTNATQPGLVPSKDGAQFFFGHVVTFAHPDDKTRPAS